MNFFNPIFAVLTEVQPQGGKSRSSVSLHKSRFTKGTDNAVIDNSYCLGIETYEKSNFSEIGKTQKIKKRKKARKFKNMIFARAKSH